MEQSRIKTIDASQESSPLRPAKKKSKSGKFLIFLILVIGLGAFFVFKYNESQPTKVVENSLKLLKEKDTKKVYQATSDDFKKETSLETFTLFIKQNPSLTKNKKSSFPEKKSAKNSIILKGTLTSKDGTITPIRYKLVKQDGTWKIEGIEISPTE